MYTIIPTIVQIILYHIHDLNDIVCYFKTATNAYCALIWYRDGCENIIVHSPNEHSDAHYDC